MREYPRRVKFENKPESSKIVNNELEEYEASIKGYESHWSPEVNKKRKGTAREILRIKPEVVVDIEGNKSYVMPEKVEVMTAQVIEPKDEPLTRGQKAWATRQANEAAKQNEVEDGGNS